MQISRSPVFQEDVNNYCIITSDTAFLSISRSILYKDPEGINNCEVYNKHISFYWDLDYGPYDMIIPLRFIQL